MTVRYSPADGSSVEKLGALIWDNLYAVRVPYIETQSAQMMKDFGIPTLGSRHMDRQMHQDLVNVVIPIDSIVEYFRRGVTVRMQNNDDTLEIYHIVNNYLLAWKQQIDNCLNLGNVPTEDLLLLDRFAEMLYPIAQTFGAAPRDTGSLFANLYSGNGRFVSRGSLFGGTPVAEAIPERGKHKNIGGELARAIAALNQSWN